MGSLIPSADVAVLEQMRADGSVRDTFHLSPARAVILGRESGDWVFPYDQTMSGKHCEVRSQDAEFFVHDSGSRNGVALAVRGDFQLKTGTRILVGDQVLRVESVGS
jgi:predicted component of type VI protein secretion system